MALVKTLAQHVGQQRVEQRGHNGVRTWSAAGEFGGEQIDKRPQRGVLSDAGWQVDDRWQLAEQRMRPRPVEQVRAAQQNDRAGGEGVVSQIG